MPRFVGWMPRRKNTSTLTRPSEFAVVRLAVFPVNRVHDRSGFRNDCRREAVGWT
ncbi:hypothetical protein RBSWK_05829 [Rhodopirellula baltica SWK14]|uniref:Uncharacterized protein n=1 Tax=Rhodopirellula baltica SWK14 TaxID=993516 RepID=L7CAU7_RHOBT|nr:hypothetical protein RBSWK_05829 [Rhodopirellula baltica SWK14]